MADSIDRACQIEQLHRDNALAKVTRLKNQNPSLLYCQDCGDDIPTTRRLMIVGCMRCVSCQSEYEQQQRNFRR